MTTSPMKAWVAAISFLFLLACDGEAPQEPAAGGRASSTTASSEGSPSDSSPMTLASWGGPVAPGTLAYVHEGDIWLHDPWSGKTLQITADATAREESVPRFIGRDRLSFLSGDDGTQVLKVVDLATGAASDVVEGRIVSYAWAPNGQDLVTEEVAGRGQTALFLRTGRDDPIELRRFGLGVDGGTYPEWDEYQLGWSPDGSSILFVDTRLSTSFSAEKSDPTLFVLRRDGTDLIPPVPNGTMARWDPDGEQLYFLADRWRVFDTSTGATTKLDFDLGPFPTVSPDGQFIAYNETSANPTVVVRDLTTGTTQEAAADAVQAIWLAPDALAVSDTRPCPRPLPDCEAGGHGTLWEEVGTVSRITLGRDARVRLPLPSTNDVDVAR